MRRAVSLLFVLGSLLAPLLGVLPPAPADAAEAFALDSFQEVWAQADAPVATGRTSRTWLWGPTPVTPGRYEPYAEAPGGQRLVQYFDKARMEDNRYRAAVDPWRVTTGLLVVEMVSGRMAVADARAEDRQPARVSVAGDPGGSPTYADLAPLRSEPATPVGDTITARLAQTGQVSSGGSPEIVRAARHVVETNHAVAEPFWTYMNGAGLIGGNPFFATGFPITEAYWTDARVGGQPRAVLLQAFERRVLTYTPGNPAGFVVEMGNVGRHYHEWRYGLPPEAGTPPPASDTLVPTPVRVPAALGNLYAADRLQHFTGRTVHAPSGLTVVLFGLVDRARFAAFSPAGDLYVATPGHAIGDATIHVLPDRDRDGVADEDIVFAGGLDRAHSLAVYRGAVYVAETGRVLRLEDLDGDRRADTRVEIVPQLPPGGQHWTRTVAFGPDGKLYVSVGSSCNVCLETDWRRATILQFNPDGSGGRVFAKGLRNSVGLAWQPGTGRLYATENGRDYLGDDLPPEEVNLIADGGDYGWPRCHGRDVADPEFGKRPDACANQTGPAVEIPAHSAPLGIDFLTGSSWPTGLHGDAVVALHGSWNRSLPTGYKLVRLRFWDGQPTGEVLDFVTGFRQANGQVWARPVGVVMGPDGSLYVTADVGSAIFRIGPATASP